jgi:hypothetical protein
VVNLDIKFWGEKMKKIQFLVIAAILSFGLIISSAILSNMVEKVNKREDSISVKGVAERKVKANKGVLILTLMRSNKTAEDAYSKLEEDLTTIKDEITILNLVENEIEYSNIKTEPIYNGNTKEISSYNVYQTITITTNKVDTLANTSLELSKLTLKLPNLVVDTPEYYLTDIEKYKNDLIKSATNNAKNTAIDVLKVNGKEIGDIKSLIQDEYKIFTTIDLNSNKTQKSNELSAINKVIRANVTATYVIK